MNSVGDSLTIEVERRIDRAVQTRERSLDLSGLGITSLPEAIGQLANLELLNLGENQLVSLPTSIGQLTRLKLLYLRRNRLTSLPEAIGQLANLELLDLGENQLVSLPTSIGQLTSLEQLDLDGNRGLTSPPPEIRSQGTGAVLAFLRALDEPSIERWRSKILIVGEANVGKTSLSKRLLGEPFDPTEGQTHGVQVRPLSLPHPERPDISMELDMWDFGGQLEYRATQRFYLTDRSLFLLVWNARARSADGKVIAWLDAIKARVPDAPILVVATHGDEDSPATLPHDLRRDYPGIVGFRTVDSLTGLGIRDLLDSIAHYAAHLPLMGARWPVAWDAGARSLSQLPEQTVTVSRACRSLADAGVTDDEAQQVILRMLHDLGDIAYFADIPDLAKKIILKPEWLDARITQVIDSPRVTEADGMLTRAERDRLWTDLAEAEDDPDLPNRLILMMENFDLAYRTGDDSSSNDIALIVDRLPESPTPAVDDEWRKARAMPNSHEISIMYKLTSRQAGIPTWFIAREHRYATSHRWRNGVLLHDRDPETPAWALLTDDGREQPTITLRVTGAYPIRFRSVLIEALDSIINARYPGLVEARLVPCACQDGSDIPCKHVFTLEELIVEATDEEPGADHKIRCPKSKLRIEAALMLEGLRGTSAAAQFDTLQREIDTQSLRLSEMDARQQAELNGIRALLETRANAGIHCPALFSIREDKSGVLRRTRITVTHWCEWPSGPHPLDGEDGSYTITKMPDALIRYLPYLDTLITALGIAAPAIGGAGLAASEQIKEQVNAASETLKFIRKNARLTDLASKQGLPGNARRTIRAQTSADLRSLQNMLTALDPENTKNWGGLNPYIRPEDQRTIYLCARHTQDFDFPYVR